MTSRAEASTTARLDTHLQAFADWSVFAGLVFSTLLALGGAASSPAGVLIGVPPPIVAGGVLLAATAWASTFGVKGARRAGGLLLIPLLLLFAPRLPGIQAFSGPSLLTVVFAGLVCIVVTRRPWWTSRAFFPVILLLCLAYSVRARQEVGAQGDEPHYLMVADTLLRSHDLALEDAYAEGRYRAFHPSPLEPHYRVRGRGGHIYSLHALGLSLLILPAYAVSGYAGASLFLALLAALLAWEIRGLVESWTGDSGLAEGIGWVVGLGAPVLHYSGLIFTEIPCALLVAVVLRRGSEEKGLGHGALLACAAAFLPWLNVRYVPLSLVLLLYLLAERTWRQKAAVLLPNAVSAVGIGLYYFHLYGFLDPRRVYGARPELSFGLVPEGLSGMLLDQEFGLLTYAPFFALAIPGLLYLFRDSPRRGALAFGLILSVLIPAACWPMWRGGFNPPGRFLLPVVPVLAACAAHRLRTGLRGGAALLMGWTLFVGLAGARHPRLVHRDREGTAPLFRATSGALEWTRLLPRYVLQEPDRHILGVVWGVSLLAAATGLRIRTRSYAMASLGLVLATGTAALLGEGRSEGRDAVQLVGRRAVLVPGFHRVEWPAEFGPEALLWGPVYEPQRHPLGVEMGSLLALPSARYRLAIQADVFGEAAEPSLTVAGRKSPLQRVPEGWVGGFEVPADATEESLVFRGGPPFLLKRIVLFGGDRSAQPNAIAQGQRGRESFGP